MHRWLSGVMALMMACGGEVASTPEGDAAHADTQRAMAEVSSEAEGDAPGSDALAAPEDLRGMRYCEILLVFIEESGIAAEVWGTQGLSLCPQEAWEALDPEEIQETYGAMLIKMNGPRYSLMNRVDGVELPDEETRLYGDLEMQQLATITFDEPPSNLGPFRPITVLRTNTWIFSAGEEIYELTDPEGTHYVMQAYAQIVDPTLEESDLPGLADRIALPEGWSYSARVLSEDLLVVAEGEAIVLQDDLENTYQRR